MPILPRRVDKKARVLLFPDFAGQLVVVERVGENEIRLRRARVVPRKYTLAQLLAGVTPENVHAEVDFGRTVGKERGSV